MSTVEVPEAGLRSLDHCKYLLYVPSLTLAVANFKSNNSDKERLPFWRYYPRQKLIPIIRLETPYLAWLQSHLRKPALDSYFAVTANLGTHTFFMIVLPILFWCGYTSLGRGYEKSLHDNHPAYRLILRQYDTHSGIRGFFQRFFKRFTMPTATLVTTTPSNHNVWLCCA